MIMNRRKLTKQSKFAIQITAVVVFLVVMAVITVLCVPLIKALRTVEGREQIQEIVGSHRFLGVVMYLVLQALQVVVAIIPGGPIQLLGGVLFGPFFGTLLSFLGIFIGTLGVFYLVKAIGYPLVETLVSKKDIKSLKFLSDEKRLETLVFIMFLIPGVPKDALTYLVPLTNMPAKVFFLYAMLARLPSIIMSTVVGHNISRGNFVTSIVIFAVTLAIGLVGILYKDKIISKVRRKRN